MRDSLIFVGRITTSPLHTARPQAQANPSAPPTFKTYEPINVQGSEGLYMIVEDPEDAFNVIHPMQVY